MCVCLRVCVCLCPLRNFQQRREGRANDISLSPRRRQTKHFGPHSSLYGRKSTWRRTKSPHANEPGREVFPGIKEEEMTAISFKCAPPAESGTLRPTCSIQFQTEKKTTRLSRLKVRFCRVVVHYHVNGGRTFGA